MIIAKYLGLTANQLAETASKLEAENAKLRELITSYLRRARSPVGLTVERDYDSEFRALGIDVPYFRY